MGKAIGEILPYAFGAAISVVSIIAIIAIILMVVTPGQDERHVVRGRLRVGPVGDLHARGSGCRQQRLLVW